MPTSLAATIRDRELLRCQRLNDLIMPFDALAPGQALLLVNDHDPQPLHYQFEERSGGQYDWTYLEAGPDLWRIRIGKQDARQSRAVGDSCCSGGACCG